MKLRSTTPVRRIRAKRLSIIAVAVLIAVATPIAVVTGVTHAESISQLQARIDALQSQQSQYQKSAQALRSKANTLKGKIAVLQNQQAQMQTQINLTQAKYDKLQRQIEETKQKISDNQDALGSTIADMYVDGDITPLEMLASSKNIGDFVDKQAYQESISQQLTGTIKQINELKVQLEDQQQQVKLTLTNQQNAKKELAASQAEQQRLLSQTKGEEGAYQDLIRKNQAQQDALSRQIADQMRATIQSGGATVITVGGSGGGYPYNCAVNQYAVSPWVDDYGYGCSQCVSFAAWKMGQVYGKYPVSWGNADMFPGNARAAGFHVSYVPRANSIVFFPSGVNGAGSVGHVGWVEAVNGNTITVSQYNYYVSGYSSPWGHYSVMTFQNYGGMQYIYP